MLIFKSNDPKSANLSRIVSQGGIVCTATRYGLDSLGFEPRWGGVFVYYPDWPCDPPCLLYNGYRVFPGGKAAGP